MPIELACLNVGKQSLLNVDWYGYVGNRLKAFVLNPFVGIREEISRRL